MSEHFRFRLSFSIVNERKNDFWCDCDFVNFCFALEFFLLLVILLSSVGTFYFELPILNFFFMVGRGVGWVWGVTKKLLCCSLDILCFLLGLGGIHFCCDNFHHNLHNIQTTTSLKVLVRSASYLNRTTLATSQSRTFFFGFISIFCSSAASLIRSLKTKCLDRSETLSMALEVFSLSTKKTEFRFFKLEIF